MQDKQYISTTEAAKILKISRVTVFKKIKRGQIKASKIGRNFVIDRNELSHSGGPLLQKEKYLIEQAVGKTVKEYGETLKLLGDA
jgi:excisionase family DNA binding protein